MRRHRSGAHALRLLVVALLAAVATVGGAVVPTAPAALAQGQVLTWTADGSVTEYKSAPTTATAGEVTIVFENSTATGNAIAMPHTLTFDTSTPGYNHDVSVNILANPTDAQGGRHEATATLTPGRYRYFCSIPGHAQMVGELVVTEGGDPGDPEDTTAPTVTAEVAGEQDTGGNYVGSATVTVEAEDAGSDGGPASGVDTVEYQLDGGEWAPYTEPVEVTAEGEHTLNARATDVAGNASEEVAESFTVVAGGGGDPDPEDTTAPTVTTAVNGEQDADGNYVGSATVAVTAEDAGTDGGPASGVDTVEYQLDGGEWTPYTEPVQVTGNGEHMLHARATDVAGNASTEVMVMLTIVEEQDVEGPTMVATVTGDMTADWKFLGRASLGLSASDPAGVRVLEYSLDGAAWQRYTRPVVVEALGTHTVRYRSWDQLDNASPQQVATFTIVAMDADPNAPARARKDVTVLVDGDTGRPERVQVHRGAIAQLS